MKTLVSNKLYHVNCLLLKLNCKLRKMFLSPRQELQGQMQGE